MAILQASDINNLNTTISEYGELSKYSSSLTSVNLHNSTANNVVAGTIVVPINLENLKKAINILEQKFSLNCCQSQCHNYSTISSCQVCQSTNTVCQSSTCQSCQGCQTCQGCQSCQSQCRCNCDCDCYCHM